MDSLLSHAGLARFDELCNEVRAVTGESGLTLNELRDCHILAEEEVDRRTPESYRAQLCRHALGLPGSRFPLGSDEEAA